MTEPRTESWLTCDVPSCTLPKVTRKRRWCSLHSATFTHHGVPSHLEKQANG